MSDFITVECIYVGVILFCIYQIISLSMKVDTLKSEFEDMLKDVNFKMSSMKQSLEIARGQCVHILEDVKNIAKEIKNGIDV